MDSAYQTLPAFLTALLFAASAICGKRLSDLYGGLAASFFRLLLAVILLGAGVLFLGERGFLAPGVFGWILLSGLVGFGYGDVTLYLAFSRIGSRLVLLIVSATGPVFALLAESLWLGAHPRGVELAAMSVIGLGLLVALWPSAAPGEDRPVRAGGAGSWVGGVFLAIQAGLGQGLGVVLSRRADVASDHETLMGAFSPALGQTFLRVSAGCAVAFFSWQIGKRFFQGEQFRAAPEAAPSATRATAWLVGAATFGPVLGVTCMQWALFFLPGGLCLAIIALAPLLIIPLSAWLEGDRPTPRSLAGTLLAVAGVAWISVTRV